MGPLTSKPVNHISHELGRVILADRDQPTIVARKKARIVALKMDEPFTVATDRGLMRAEAGDWLVTNHPDDDPGSDVWSISAERMANTYEEVEK